MDAHTLRRAFIEFFVKHKRFPHQEIPSASLMPDNDPTVLFTTAGMHPLVPFLMGEKHQAGKRLVDVQKCLRTDDIDEVGDRWHLTFFEMMGNWSLGDYFKKEAIEMSMEFLTDVLKFDPKKIYTTVFEGDNDAPRDDESMAAWKEEFQKRGVDPMNRIFLYEKKKNWWGPAGQTGPCGPDTEMFYDTGQPHNKAFGAQCHPNCDCGRFVEVWNDVLMQYMKHEDGTFTPLQQKNVDTGLGFERVLTILQGKDDMFTTELFWPAIQKLQTLAHKIYAEDLVAFRIIADHLRAVTFILGDTLGVVPSNVDQGYVVRRLIRRAIRYGKKIGITRSFTAEIANVYIPLYSDTYHELIENAARIVEELQREEEQFDQTLKKGEKEFEKAAAAIAKTATKEIVGDLAFHLYDTYGFPLEMTKDLAKEQGLAVDEKGFQEAYKKHQELSRAGATKRFAGGLADHSEETVELHTATHLLHQALRDVLGNTVFQKGSNITRERLRFDFSFDRKMTPEEIKKVEDIVNARIQDNLPVHYEFITVDEAKKRGAIGLFEEKYGDVVKVYFMGEYSKEFCGGPHVEHTGVLGTFKITKEEACARGIRRVKAIVTPV